MLCSLQSLSKTGKQDAPLYTRTNRILLQKSSSRVLPNVSLEGTFAIVTAFQIFYFKNVHCKKKINRSFRSAAMAWIWPVVLLFLKLYVLKCVEWPLTVATFAHFLAIKKFPMTKYSANSLVSVYVLMNMVVRRNALKTVAIALQKWRNFCPAAMRWNHIEERISSVLFIYYFQL